MLYSLTSSCIRWVAYALFACAVPVASAQTYPSKTVRIMIGFAPGGSTDVMVRLIQPKLTETLGQQFVVENRPGATGNIANQFVAKASPDGYTLAAVSAAFTINVSLYPKLSFDALKDFAPIARIAAVNNVLVVHPSLPVKTVKELIALAKARPGQLIFASSGSGGTGHLAAELLKTMAGGLNTIHVPYKGGSHAVIDLVAGQVHMLFSTMPSSVPHLQTGRLRAIAVASLKRASALPNVPTVSESGYPGFEALAWNAVLAPAGTSGEIITRLNAAIVKAVHAADVKERLAAQGAEPIEDTPEELSRYLAAEIAKWSKVVRLSGAKLD